jgi:alkaline phosphatase
MVEGARIDKSSHGNDFPSTVKEVLDFDQAVEAAVRFAEKDGNTLVIITAEHETGALSLRGGDPSKGNVKGSFSSGAHTGIPVPLFAYGPGSQYFMGIQENSDVSNKIAELLSK